MEGAGRGHAVWEPQPGAAAAVGIRRAAIVVARGTAVVAVDERDSAREARRDHRGGSLDADAGKASLPRRDGGVARIHSRDLAEALVIGNAVDDEAVDVLEVQAAVFQRRFQ